MKDNNLDLGGLAFPVTPTDRTGQISDTQPGMTLLDYFAGQAMTVLLSKDSFGHRDLSYEAYDMARFMIAEKRRLEKI
jgi:hypothetical protein